MVSHSTRESVENGEISALAIIETVLSLRLAISVLESWWHVLIGVSRAVSFAADRAGYRIGYRIRDTRVRETGTDRIRLSAASRYQGDHEFIREEEAESFAEHIREELDHHDKE